MSCFPGKPGSSGANPQTIYANDPAHVTYKGEWKSPGSPQNTFKVSENSGDQATFVFTGTSVQVSGQIDSQGMSALFGVDEDGRNHGGATCTNASPSSPNQEAILFVRSSLPLGEHTLFITNNGRPLSINLFEVFGGGEMSSTPPSHSQFPESTTALSSVATPLSSSNGSPLPISNSPPPVAGPSSSTAQSSSHLGLPLPFPTATTQPSEIIPSHVSPTETDSAGTIQYNAGGSLSYTRSSYTEVSVVGGSTTIIVIQTTVEVRQTQPYPGPSRGAVAGAAVGGVLFLFLLVGLGLWWWRRRRNRVRFLYGISNLDFDPAMVTRSSAELPTQGRPGVRDSDATMYGDILPPYKRPVSYSSLASDLKKDPPVEYAPSVVAGDHRLAVYAELKTRSPSEERLSLCNSHSVRGQGSVEPVVPPSKGCHEALR